MNEKLQAALAYAEKGWAVFPADSSGKKKSHKSAEFSNGQRWGATNNAEEIRRNFRKWPDANIGIPTGKVAGFFVVEADTVEGHGVDGIAALRALEAEHGALPTTRAAESPSGSLHFYFRWPTDDTLVRNSESLLAEGIDVRGEGGMVIAPPSVRPGKGGYVWINEGPIAEAPQWVLDLVIAEVKPRGPTKLNGHAVELKELDRTINGERQPLTRPQNRRLNAAALKNLPAWVPALFGDAAVLKSGGVYRVSSKALGRDLEEDLGISPKGIKDFGVADQGDPREGRRTPIDLVMVYGKMADAEAAKWLAGKIGHAEGVSVDDLYAHMATHLYYFVPTGELWPAASVNACLPSVALVNADGSPQLGEPDKNGKAKQKHMPASAWLDRNRRVEQMTWAPGHSLEIPDRLIANGGWIERAGVMCLNLYRPPTIQHGDASQAGPWIDHVRKVYPNDVDHLIKWCAHRKQHPEDKINHALVIGGEPGIGKDTLLEPVKQAVGPWNFAEISPQDLLAPFTGYDKSVILRISEARDLGDLNRYQFYERLKIYAAAPPDVLRCNEKYLREHYVLNCCGVIITTNYKTDGIYLPANDRRHYVAWSDLVKEDFDEGYWNALWSWYQSGGYGHVAAYLATLDLSDFDPKAPPPKTEAFWAIVDVNRPPEDSELADIIDALGNPTAITLSDLMGYAEGQFLDWLMDRKNSRQISRRLEQCGYMPVRSTTKDGQHVIRGRRQTIYARATLSVNEQHVAAAALVAAAHRGWKVPPPPKFTAAGDPQ